MFSQEFYLILFGILAAGVLALIIWAVQRDASARKQALTGRGFTPLAQVPPELAAGLRQLNPQAGAKNVHVLNRAAYTLYSFDWAEPGESDSVSTRAWAALALPGARMPRFMLFPRIDVLIPAGLLGGIGGALGGWLEGLVEQTLARSGMHRVELARGAGFEQAYTLLGEDDAALDDFFTLERCSRLAQARYYQVNGAGELLAFSRLDPSTRRGADSLDSLVEGAGVLFAVFRD